MSSFRGLGRDAAVSAGVCAALLAASCSAPKKPIVVGSSDSSEQVVVAEIIALHLEHRLKQKVVRRLKLGTELILYQAILSGDIDMYPDYLSAIGANILKERLDPDLQIVRERVRSEMRRTAKLEVTDPLGYDSTPVAVVRTADADKAQVSRLSQLAESSVRWKLGVSYDFQQRSDGLAVLSAYKIPLGEETRAMDALQLFPSLEQGTVSMIVVPTTDGHLPSPQFTVLTDDKSVFPSYEACLLVREERWRSEPMLQEALSELSGKLSNAAVRKLSAAVEVDGRDPQQVAAGFLAEIGLK